MHCPNAALSRSSCPHVSALFKTQLQSCDHLVFVLIHQACYDLETSIGKTSAHFADKSLSILHCWLHFWMEDVLSIPSKCFPYSPQNINYSTPQCNMWYFMFATLYMTYIILHHRCMREQNKCPNCILYTWLYVDAVHWAAFPSVSVGQIWFVWVAA